MKTNKRTVKVYDSTLRLASRMAFRLGLSMTEIVELAIAEAAEHPEALAVMLRGVKASRPKARANVRRARPILAAFDHAASVQMDSLP